MCSSSCEDEHSEPVYKGIHSNYHLKEVLHNCGSSQCPVLPVYVYVLRNLKVCKIIALLFSKKEWASFSQFSKAK